MVKEMCSASYRATQQAGKLTITARGTHNRTGYEVSFERFGVTYFPPQFSFMHQAPAKASLLKSSPFEYKITIETDREIDNIVIYDAKGRHVVEVEQVDETCASPVEPD